jgi:hypothetical protein
MDPAQGLPGKEKADGAKIGQQRRHRLAAVGLPAHRGDMTVLLFWVAMKSLAVFVAINHIVQIVGTVKL